MSAETRSKISNHSDRISFWLVVGTILVSATYALIELQEFPEDAAMWPRILSVFIIIGCLLILFSDYLPSHLQMFLEDEELIGGTDDELDEEMLAEDEETEVEADEREARVFGGALFTVIASVGYIVLGYLIGLLWATPIFTFVYMWNARVSYRYNVPLTVLAFLIAYGFYDVIFLPIDGGVLFQEGLLSLVMFR